MGMVIVPRSQGHCRDCSHQVMQKAELSAWHIGYLDTGWELFLFIAAFIHLKVWEVEWSVEKTLNQGTSPSPTRVLVSQYAKQGGLRSNLPWASALLFMAHSLSWGQKSHKDTWNNRGKRAAGITSAPEHKPRAVVQNSLVGQQAGNQMILMDKYSSVDIKPSPHEYFRPLLRTRSPFPDQRLKISFIIHFSFVLQMEFKQHFPRAVGGL